MTRGGVRTIHKARGGCWSALNDASYITGETSLVVSSPISSC